jgi:uncharacterized protein with HEPN domain
MRRPVDKLLEDILRATDVAAAIVAQSRARFADDLVLQFAAEAVIGRVGDAASKLPAEALAAMPGVPWKEIIGFRIVVDHAYHRLDYSRVWNTLVDDLPNLHATIEEYRRRAPRSRDS